MRSLSSWLIVSLVAVFCALACNGGSVCDKQPPEHPCPCPASAPTCGDTCDPTGMPADCIYDVNTDFWCSGGKWSGNTCFADAGSSG